MGCFWSKQEREIRPQLAYTCHYYETRFGSPQSSLPTITPRPAKGPFYGKYRCHTCNRHWDSRFCWPDKYQICKGCRKQIYPYTHREVNSSDFDNEVDKSKEHQRDLCQMCQQRGYLCIKDKRLPKAPSYGRSRSR